MQPMSIFVCTSGEWICCNILKMMLKKKRGSRAGNTSRIVGCKTAWFFLNYYVKITNQQINMIGIFKPKVFRETSRITKITTIKKKNEQPIWCQKIRGGRIRFFLPHLSEWCGPKNAAVIAVNGVSVHFQGFSLLLTFSFAPAGKNAAGIIGMLQTRKQRLAGKLQQLHRYWKTVLIFRNIFNRRIGSNNPFATHYNLLSALKYLYYVKLLASGDWF